MWTLQEWLDEFKIEETEKMTQAWNRLIGVKLQNLPKFIFEYVWKHSHVLFHLLDIWLIGVVAKIQSGQQHIQKPTVDFVLAHFVCNHSPYAGACAEGTAGRKLPSFKERTLHGSPRQASGMCPISTWTLTLEMECVLWLQHVLLKSFKVFF